MLVRSTVCSIVPLSVPFTLRRRLAFIDAEHDAISNGVGWRRKTAMAKLSRYAMVLVLWGFWTVPYRFLGRNKT